ncbi:hypothetical protein HY643_04590 [Candidatus Woesearchaeota archaeon]|nr:hypothetical protein [Candidatus Woesearchaeota archaeon]
MKNKGLTAIIAATIATVSIVGCAKNPQPIIKQANNIEVPTYNKKQAEKIEMKGDLVDGMIEEGDINKDGRFDAVAHVYFADRNGDGVGDLVHAIHYAPTKWLKRLKLVEQAMLIDDNYDGVIDRTIVDMDGDNVYEKEVKLFE